MSTEPRSAQIVGLLSQRSRLQALAISDLATLAALASLALLASTAAHWSRCRASWEVGERLTVLRTGKSCRKSRRSALH